MARLGWTTASEGLSRPNLGPTTANSTSRFQACSCPLPRPEGRLEEGAGSYIKFHTSTDRCGEAEVAQGESTTNYPGQLTASSVQLPEGHGLGIAGPKGSHLLPSRCSQMAPWTAGNTGHLCDLVSPPPENSRGPRHARGTHQPLA